MGNPIYLISIKGGCDWSAEDAYSFVEPDPTFVFGGSQFCPTFDIVDALFAMDYINYI
jgi:hypothetical protein